MTHKYGPIRHHLVIKQQMNLWFWGSFLKMAGVALTAQALAACQPGQQQTLGMLMCLSPSISLQHH